MAGFIQIIEFRTTRIDEFRTALEERRNTGDDTGPNLVKRAVVAQDKDRPNTYLNIVEFESYESAMENSNRPETSEMAAKFAEMCDEPPRFYNLEVIETYEGE